MPPLIIPSAEPFFIPGDSTGCLLVHGFTGTPKEMRWLGKYLADQGHTVLAIRLPGHATHPEELLRVRWQDWMASVEDGLNLLRHISKRVFVLGLSMGGALALLAAANYPIDGVVAMSTPYSLPEDWRIPYARLFSIFKPWTTMRGPEGSNPQVGSEDISYPDFPTRVVIELDGLFSAERKALPDIHVPVLLVHSHMDESVLPENMEKIYQNLGSQDKQMLWIENSGHVIIRESQRQTVFEAAAGFINRLNGTV